MSREFREEEDEAIRIAKVFGCKCAPFLVNTEVRGSTRYTTLRHTKNCHYDPAKVFAPQAEVDQEAIDAGAKLQKKARARVTRAQNRSKAKR